MEIRQLKYFVEICRCRSFSQAAAFCYMSPQGISMSIIRLEEELGCKLFHRSPRGVLLTPQAEFLLPRAKKILSVVDECSAYFNDGGRVETLLPLVCSHGTLEEYGGAVIAELGEKYPDIRINVRECSDTDCDEAVLNDEAEMGLTVGPVPEELFHAQHLFSSRYALIVSDEHPLAEREKVSIDELKGLNLAVMKGGLRTYPCLRAACLKAGFEPKVQVFADNILLVFYMATTKNVCGISTWHLFRRLNLPHLRAVPIDSSDFTWDVYAIRKKNAALSPAAKLVWQAMAAKKNSQTK